ncbi:MAG: hypothetical protein ACR2MQ_00160 [Gemmatimonadaceae bacterium]
MNRQTAQRWRLTVAALAFLSACTAHRYDNTAQRSGVAEAAGVTSVRVIAGAGWLRVAGRPGITQIHVSGIAHASSEAFLEHVRLTVTRSGSVVEISAQVPDEPQSIGQAAALDLSVEVPSTMALNITDQSGETIIHNVGPLTIVDNGGGLEIEGVTGDLDVTDGAGELQVSDVHGQVYIRDGAGAIYVSNVHGSVNIPKDGSGEIQVSEVTGDLTIGAKESGEVSARDVGGNFVVDAKGSGSVEYHGIKGHVSVPVHTK